MLLNVEIDGALVKLRLPEVRRFAEGDAVRIAFDRADVLLFDPETRRRIDWRDNPGQAS